MLFGTTGTTGTTGTAEPSETNEPSAIPPSSLFSIKPKTPFYFFAISPTTMRSSLAASQQKSWKVNFFVYRGRLKVG